MTHAYQLPADEEAPSSVVINPHSELGKELRKWEQHVTELTPRGTRPGNPYVYRQYPVMLYRAQPDPRSGKVFCVQPAPEPWLFDRMDQLQQEQLRIEAFNKSNQRIVKDEAEERLATGQGWAASPDAALDVYERQQQAVAEAAAQAHYAAARMNEPAQREWTAAQDATHAHVVDVQGPKRGRKRIVTGTGPIED